MLYNRQQSKLIIISTLIVIAMGFFFKYYPGIGHEWLNNYGAAIFYEIFGVYLLLGFSEVEKPLSKFLFGFLSLPALSSFYNFGIHHY